MASKLHTGETKVAVCTLGCLCAERNDAFWQKGHQMPHQNVYPTGARSDLYDYLRQFKEVRNRVSLTDDAALQFFIFGLKPAL